MGPTKKPLQTFFSMDCRFFLRFQPFTFSSFSCSHCAGPSRKIEIREEAEPWWGKHLADLVGGLRELLIAQSLAWKEKRRRPVDLSFQRLEGLKDVEMMGKADSWKIIDAEMYFWVVVTAKKYQNTWQLSSKWKKHLHPGQVDESEAFLGLPLDPLV